MMNLLRIRLGGPYFTVFLVNRMTIDLQNRQMGLAGMGGFIAQLAKSVLAQPNFRFDSSSPTGSKKLPKMPQFRL